ncbi:MULTISPECIES: Cro/CI family transcriptional regulator [Neisseria]|nr:MULTISPECIES: Cro/CI family transcriptional regulator [Neisseria]MDO1509499.1 Cro/CI family transcriptional regulator [Neisseria sp. MVDL19-042950]MDO1515729.1 Cro/CI family transcriptional regulator [Neisseria sp. MVDL18-041461]MDO1563447.1 Cro/CI family transcriptional regulator [Neisseria sp. MVDL20-010259]UOO83882.1 Cro/CI family transcriptional regulator [Neisseria dumasiana]VEH87826.1 DNA-binding transcriptional regulator DicC [Neisseria animaloris]
MMLTKDVIDFYGTKIAVARALGISPSAVTQWKEIVPEKQAYRIQRMTGGKLKINPRLYQVQEVLKAKKP